TAPTPRPPAFFANAFAAVRPWPLGIEARMTIQPVCAERPAPGDPTTIVFGSVGDEALASIVGPELVPDDAVDALAVPPNGSCSFGGTATLLNPCLLPAMLPTNGSWAESLPSVCQAVAEWVGAAGVAGVCVAGVVVAAVLDDELPPIIFMVCGTS